MKKNLIILGLGFLGVFLLIFGPALLGIGKQTGQQTNTASGQLRVWSYTDEQKGGAMGAAVQAAAKAVAKVGIAEWRTEKDPDTYSRGVLLALTGSTPPDVIALPLSDLPRWQGQLQPSPTSATDAPAAEQVYARAAAVSVVRAGTGAQGVITNELVAAPMALDPLVLLYHKSAFAGYVGGYQPADTWDALLEQITELRSSGATPLDIGPEHPWGTHILLALALQNGQQITNGDGSVNQSREAGAALDAAYATWQQLAGTKAAAAGVPRALQGPVPAASTGDASADAIARFARGETSMLIATASARPMVLAALEAAKKAERDLTKRNAMPAPADIAIAALPQRIAGQRVTLADGVLYGVTSNTQTAAAWAWIDQLTASTDTLSAYAEEKGMATSVAALNASIAKKDADNTAVYQMANGATPLYLPGSAAAYTDDLVQLLSPKPSRIGTRLLQLLDCRIASETGRTPVKACK